MEQHSGLTLRDIFHVLFKRKWMIILFFLSTVVTGGTIAMLSEQPVYEATAQILLRPGREHVYDLSVSTAGQVRPGVSFDLAEEAARTIAMLTGRYLSEQVVQKLGAQELCREPVRKPVPFLSKYCDPELDDQTLFYRVVELVQKNVSASRVGDAALVNLSFYHQDPVLAAKVANTLAGLYVEHHLGVLKDPKAAAFVEEQLRLLKPRLNTAEKEVEAFKQKHGLTSTVREDREIMLRQLTALQGEHSETRSRQAEVSSRIAQLKGQFASTATNPQAITATREKLVGLERRESELALQLGDRNPTLVGLREQIRRTREELFQGKDGVLYQGLQEELLRNEAELTALKARIAAQAPRLTELRSNAEKLESIEWEFDRLEQRAKSERQNYDLYSTKSEEARISNAMDAEKIASVRVTDPARPPIKPAPSKLMLKLLLAGMFGAIGGLVIAFGLEILGHRLDTAERAERALGLPVLASIPSLRPE